MSTRITREPLIIPKENLEIHFKKATKDGKTKRSKAAAKKGGAALGSRKALNDITNKSFLRHKTSRKKELTEEDIDIAEEGFLHDHRKCIEAQKNDLLHALDWNLVLPGHDESMGKSTNPMPEPEKMDLTSLHCWDVEKLWIPESSWRSETTVTHISPPYSPLDCESPYAPLDCESPPYTSVIEFELRPLEELLMMENSWWSETSVKHISSSSSPPHCESTTSVLEFEDLKCELRPENEV